ncbi:aftiphilin a isoform X2 [Esox lucius]|uniref:Aftiphilin clathrin-binding box domain-containing protein n=1 Tax=Esox lucius TaxID=8010 RepID=A0A3P8ZZX6_ESOLU|nr:aftiphilin a isoform X2 [Esox lucius]
MEPDVIRMYSSSPPPMEDGAEEEDDEFGDFGGFSGVPTSISFTEFDTPATYNQTPALAATSPPELINNGGVVGSSNLSSGPMGRVPLNELSKSKSVMQGGCQDDSLSERTVIVEELKKLADHTQANNHSNTLDISGSSQIDNIDKILDCNGGVSEVLTNGFGTYEMEGNQSVHSKKKGIPLVTTECAEINPPSSPEEDFADFSAFSNTDAQGHPSEVTNSSSEDLDNPNRDKWLAGNACQQEQEHTNVEQGISAKDNVRDTLCSHIRTEPNNIAGSVALPQPAESKGTTEGLSNGGGNFHRDAANSEQRDFKPDFAHEHSGLRQVCSEEFATEVFYGKDSAPKAVDVEKQVTQNGLDLEQLEDDDDDDESARENGVLPETDSADGDGEQADERRGSGNETEAETETETETSFGRPLSTDALEEFGDFSTTGSVPSPPLQEETATPADHSQLPEDDDGEDFGDFGDVGTFSGQGFVDFDQPSLQGTPATQEVVDVNEDFGDFDAAKSNIGDNNATEDEDVEKFADFPGSDSFADFSSAPVGAEPDADAGWNAFDEPEEGPGDGNSWAAFGEEAATAVSLEAGEDEWHESEPAAAHPACKDQISRKDSQSAALCSRLEKLFQAMFPEAAVPHVREKVVPLKTLLEPPERLQQEESDTKSSGPDSGVAGDELWRQLLDIHEAFGLRHQWGGSHSNKKLLCSLGIDIRNILFTGQKKQPVIVPMYAASLGMLEPTKEPVKPISAAEMIASIAQQAQPVAPVEIISISAPPDTAQEALPPVQFDWSSSGLTNPLDGVDPELYELTTAKLDPSGSGSRVADAFARLMSTMEKTSTSTRKPRKEENLSEEASKVIAGLPDLSFMQAKVLMFPTTLTPLGCSTDPVPD